MSPTVRDLLAIPELGLTVAAGRAGIDRSVRWVHTSELEDPTPWLRGGELLLTTGMALRGSPAAQRSYFRRLASAGITGLGFGLGFGFDEVPAAIRRAADRDGFPVLEVPYPVPFLAIAEAVASRLGDERVRVVQMSVEIHERLAALVADGSGPADLLDEVVAIAGGWALLFDLRGAVVAGAAAGAGDSPDARVVWNGLPRGLLERRGPATSTEAGPGGSQVALAVTTRGKHEGVLVFGKDQRLDERDRIVVHHAVTVLGLLLSSRRAVIEAERRIAGDVLAEAFAGRISGADLERRLELAGFPPTEKVAALAVEVPVADDEEALEDVAWSLDGALGAHTAAARTAVLAGRVVALVAGADAEALAEDVLPEVAGDGRDGSRTRIGVGEPVETLAVRHSYLSAVFALRAAPSQRIASPRDLGSYGFLLGAQPPGALEGFMRSVIGPLIDRDRDRSSDLVASVRAFIEAGGRWEPGAELLGIHRHTLRYRVRQVEDLLGRDLTRAEDRLEVWLALKAADVLAE